MGRIIVFLGIVCLAATFLLVLYMPFPLQLMGQSSGGTQESAQPSKAPPEEEKQSPARGKGRKKSVGKAAQPRGQETAEAQATDAPTAAADQPYDPRQAVVKSDRTPIYSLNSPTSDVLNLLRRGEKVRTELEVIQQDGTWSVVQGKGQRAGYVKAENLERGQSSKSTPGRASPANGNQ
ncbi:MAG TPA: hypothetical protein VNO70_14280 [Blastocatellia bacterium]|nr:hypothetical protein [Blastocatellia bacterium]